jgi:outer membrane immunogenic protein
MGYQDLGALVMRVALTLGLAGILAANAALAADFPAAPAYYQPIVAPVYDWSGVYIGVNAGYGFGTVSETVSSPLGFGGPLNLTGTDDLRGAVGGGQLGANYQSGSFACRTLASGAFCVVGIEVDVMGSGQKNSGSSALGLGLTFDDKITWLATARVRAGVAVDRILFYATGGGAYGEFKQTVTTSPVQVFPFSVPLITTTTSSQRGGFTAGGGVEFAVFGGLIGRLEYLYLRSADQTQTIAGVSVSNHFSDNIVRLALSYKFGGATP